MSDIATPRIVGELTDSAVHFSDTRIDRELIEELGFTATSVATLQRFSERTVFGLSLASMSPVDDSIWGMVHAGSRSQRQMVSACCGVIIGWGAADGAGRAPTDPGVGTYMAPVVGGDATAGGAGADATGGGAR